MWFLPSWKPPRSHTRCTHLRPCAPIELPSNCQDISGHSFHWNHILPMKILSNICFMFRSFFVVEGRKMFQELVWVASELHGIKRKSFCFTAASSLPPPAGSWEAFGDESQRMINMTELVQCSEPQLKTPTCWSNFWGSHIYFVSPCKSVVYLYIYIMVCLELNYNSWPLQIAVIRFDPPIPLFIWNRLWFSNIQITWSNICLQQRRSDKHLSFLLLLVVLTASDFGETKTESPNLTSKNRWVSEHIITICGVRPIASSNDLPRVGLGGKKGNRLEYPKYLLSDLTKSPKTPKSPTAQPSYLVIKNTKVTKHKQLCWLFVHGIKNKYPKKRTWSPGLIPRSHVSCLAEEHYSWVAFHLKTRTNIVDSEAEQPTSNPRPSSELKPANYLGYDISIYHIIMEPSNIWNTFVPISPPSMNQPLLQ